ncbi:S-adenosyl-L-methionine-dependent methyltransferase [Penicillium malachiteum]|uniref:S-adenosyl-L-methionine-dependent methyltransferase n=1 Tax=Penicillium malachiteum TaxID=1324776 RepID=UPI002549B970|nr:S-adenosyl-L-methionine-dependent methyltransferase [Penicillium malachiteum]KAJ5735309.1 S-adenosyl-L-methionine-dependent methyltransferase [Penicillium malachiteum]
MSGELQQLEIQSLLEDIKCSVDQFEATKSEQARVRALEKSLKLIKALEHPKDAVLKLFLSPTQAMAVKIAHDLGIFAILTGAATTTSCKQLADQSGANSLLVERIMRVLVAIDFAQEEGPGMYSPTSLSREMTDKKSGSIVDTLFVDFAPAIVKTPDFLRETNYQNPEDHSAGPIQYTYNVKMTTFEWLARDVAVHERFHNYVQGVRESRPFWVDWFPVQERILNGYTGAPSDPLIVDMACGSGRDMLALKRKFPDLTGRVILQDLPAVFNAIHSHDIGLEKIGHDIFDRQPVEGARVYFLKFILHEFSDDNCIKILQNTIQGMKKGYSKILIEEFILPDENAGLFHSMVDMILMVVGPGIVRTKSQWATILKSVGLTVNLICHPDGDGPSIIEAEL